MDKIIVDSSIIWYFCRVCTQSFQREKEFERHQEKFHLINDRRDQKIGNERQEDGSLFSATHVNRESLFTTEVFCLADEGSNVYIVFDKKETNDDDILVVTLDSDEEEMDSSTLDAPGTVKTAAERQEDDDMDFCLAPEIYADVDEMLDNNILQFRNLARVDHSLPAAESTDCPSSLTDKDIITTKSQRSSSGKKMLNDKDELCKHHVDMNSYGSSSKIVPDDTQPNDDGFGSMDELGNSTRASDQSLSTPPPPLSTSYHHTVKSVVTSDVSRMFLFSDPTQPFTFKVIKKNVFGCSHCPKKLKTRSALKTHEKVHTKPYHCPTCNKTFSSQRNVKIHERIHTGEQPYQCDHCGRRFAGQSNRNTHVKRMHRQ